MTFHRHRAAERPHASASSATSRSCAAAIRQGIGLPYGCKDGACGSCKCRLLEGRVIHGAHQQQGAERRGGSRRLHRSPAAAAPQTDLVHRGAHRARRRRVPDPQDAVPRDRDRAAARPTWRSLPLQLPANDPLHYRAGQYIEFILRDGARRSYSMANAPHTQGDKPRIELHIRHMPGGKFTDHVFSAMKEKDILRVEGPFGSFFLREDSDKPMVLLASGTGFAPIKAIIEHMQLKGIDATGACCTGAAARTADLYLDDWAAAGRGAGCRNLRYVPVLSEPQARGRLDAAAPASSTRR